MESDGLEEKQVNLPNKLTVFRIFLVPVIVFFLIYKGLENHYLYALLVFLIASYTDRLDGRIARKNGIITNFGKIMDPLADKILVVSVFICFTASGIVPTWATVLIVCREFIVTSIRFLILEDSKKIVSANMWGKLKTISQMLTLIFILSIQSCGSLFDINLFLPYIIQNVLIWISVALSVVSGIIYVLKNYKYIKVD